VAFGDPAVPHTPVAPPALPKRSSPLGPLPFARAEVKRIAELFPGAADIYFGKDATEERAKTIPREARYVHFATHATLDSSFPLNSAVVLSVPEIFNEGHDNGLLQAWEIFEQMSLDADLVILSGCETGLGKELGGEGLIGLTRAFHYAGARSVLASLWKVSDRSTAELMVRFYRHLAEGKGKDEALRQAQLELIRGLIPIRTEEGKVELVDASAPYSWAAFQIYGDWQ
jgi:CHAT domain-containing protein